MIRKRGFNYLLLLVFFLSFHVTKPATAQTPPEAPQVQAGAKQVVTVTAQRREEILTEVPISIMAISGDDLEAGGIDSIVELSQSTPGFRITRGITQPANAQIGMRGLTTQGGNSQLDPSVGLFLDGVFLPRPVTALRQLSDIDSVEVLRGPQGTLYGRNTPVGAININTRAPTFEFESRAAANFGIGPDGNKLYGLQGYVSGGLTDQVAARLAVYRHGDEGLYENLTPGGVQDSSKGMGVRAKILYEASDNFDITLIGDFDHTTQRCCTQEWRLSSAATIARRTQIGIVNRGIGDAFDHVVDNDDDQRSTANSWGISAQANLNIKDYTFTSITAFRDFKLHDDGPGDSDPARILENMDNDVKEETFSQELRVISPGDEFIDWVAGVYYYHNNTYFSNNLGFGPDRLKMVGIPAAFGPAVQGVASNDRFKQDANSVAVFGQGTVNITDQFSVTGGLRFTYDYKNGAKRQPLLQAACVQCGSTPGTASVSDTKLTWLASTRYFIIPDDLMVYFTAATGFKSGGINGTPDRAAGSPLTFGPESTRNLEIGTKMNLFDSRVSLNLSLYRMIIDDFQTRVAVPGLPGNFTANAGRLRHTGGEMELNAQPFEWLDLGLAAAYLDSKYVSFEAGTILTCWPPFAAGACSFVGRPTQTAPQWDVIGSIGLQFPVANVGFEWFGKTEVHHVSGQYYATNLDPVLFEDGYVVVDLRTGLRSDDEKWTMTFWVSNLFNEGYFVDGAPGLGGNFTRATGSYIISLGEPRRIGVEGSVKF